MNDALMIGIMLTLIFGAVVFYLYNRLTMAERKMGLVEGVLTDLKIMMDAAPYASGPPPPGMHEFEPTPEYLNAISGPVPLKEDEMEEVSEDDYQKVMTRTLQIDELAGAPLSANNAINVTKLSPDLDSMTIKELQALAKEKGLTATSSMRRKALIDLLKDTGAIQGTLLPSVESSESLVDGQ